MQSWQRIDDGTNVTKAGFRTIVHKKFRMNSGRIFQADVSGPDKDVVVGVIGLTEGNKVIIARQFRCGPEKIFEEIPGGMVDAGESPEVAARREFKEEVGFEAGELEYLGSTCVSAWDNTIHHYYLAMGCRQVSAPNPGDDEEIEIDRISIAKFIDNAKRGLMTDTEAVLLAYDKLKEIEGEQ